MNPENHPIAIIADNVPARKKVSAYPEPFASMMLGREKKALGDFFNLTNFGINLTRLDPNAMSALRHSHSKQDEFIYILEGHPTLITDEGRISLSPGMCSGFKAGTHNAHQLINETSQLVMYLEIGDRSLGDTAHYPDDDLKAVSVDGKWIFTKKNGDSF
jgi:uncharacterized cupin superfamily protein